MIESKYKYSGEDNWNFKDFNSEQEMMDFLEKDPKEIEEYKFRSKKDNWLIKYFKNIRNTKKNWNKVRASPYASLELGLKARKIILGILIPWILYLGYKLVVGVKVTGIVGILQQLFSAGIIIYIAWKLYSTIPATKRQIEYYKKYPHTINYCPTNTKETIDDILKKIEDNKIKQEVKNVQKEDIGSSERRI